MKSHIRPTNRQRKIARELLTGQTREIQDEASARTIILCVYCLWQTFGIGRNRMPKYLEMLDRFADKALRDDTWIEETVAALRKIGVDFQIEG